MKAAAGILEGRVVEEPERWHEPHREACYRVTPQPNWQKASCLKDRWTGSALTEKSGQSHHSGIDRLRE